MSDLARTRRWTRKEYDRLIEIGFLDEDEPVELVGGQLIVAEPKGTGHSVGMELRARSTPRPRSDDLARGRAGGIDLRHRPPALSAWPVAGLRPRPLADPDGEDAVQSPGFRRTTAPFGRHDLAYRNAGAISAMNR